MFVRPGIACCLVVTAVGAARAEEAPSRDGAAAPAPPTAVVRIERAPVGNNQVGDAPTFSPSGKTVAAFVDGSTLWAWNLAGGRWRHRLGRITGGGKASFSPSGAYIAGATDDGALRVWEPASGAKTLEVDAAGYALTSATFSSDDASLATVGRDGTIHVWDVDRRKVVLKLAPSARGSRPAVFLPGGKALAAVGGDRAFRMWDLASGRKRLTVSRFRRGAFSRDAKRLVALCEDSKLCLFELRTGRRLMRLAVESYGLTSAEFAPDGNTLATLSSDRTLRLWEADTGRMFQKIQNAGRGSHLGPLGRARSRGEMRHSDRAAGVEATRRRPRRSPSRARGAPARSERTRASTRPPGCGSHRRSSDRRSSLPSPGRGVRGPGRSGR
jgi:hypothetical protein